MSGDTTVLQFEEGKRTVKHGTKTGLPLLYTKPGHKSFSAYVTSQQIPTYKAQLWPNDIAIQKLFEEAKTNDILPQHLQGVLLYTLFNSRPYTLFSP